jgi:hypothetical protein
VVFTQEAVLVEQEMFLGQEEQEHQVELVVELIHQVDQQRVELEQQTQEVVAEERLKQHLVEQVAQAALVS